MYSFHTCVVLDKPLEVRLWISRPSFGIDDWLWTMEWREPGALERVCDQEAHGWEPTEEGAKQRAFTRLCQILGVSSEKCNEYLTTYQEKIALKLLGKL